MKTVKKPYQLVLILQDLEFGGTQRYAVNLLQHIDRKLFSPELWVLRGGMDMAPLAQQTGVKIIWFSTGRLVTPLALYRFARYLAGNRPCYVFSLTTVPNMWSTLFCRLFRIPVIICSCRNMEPKRLERLLWPWTSHIVCNARAIRQKLLQSYGVDSKRVSVIANGVDTDLFRPYPEKRVSRPTLLFSGRLVDVKDPLTTLKAFQIVREHIQTARLIITGNGPLEPQLKQFIFNQGLEGAVTKQPGTENIQDYLQKSWLFVISSRMEGSPNSCIEAMSCGLPVVATQVGGIPELIEDRVNGRLVPPGNYELLAESIIELLQDDKQRNQMGRMARQSVKSNHVLPACVRETEKKLLELMSSHCSEKNE